MKKAILGCLVLVALTGVGIMVAGYFFVYKPLGKYAGGLVDLAQASRLNDKVNNKSDYRPPDGGALRPEQVERFVEVQAHLRSAMGKRMDELDAKFQRIDQELKAQDREANLTHVLSGLSDMSDLYLEAKRLQVDALNDQGFSVQEYEWVRREVYRAAGLELPYGGFQEVVEAAEDGEMELQPFSGTGTEDEERVLEENRRLVEPHAAHLQETMGMAWLGL